ncbi:MAG: hypothetical protein LBO64_10810 [Desulfovibrio sp.]|jgi:hypothetical protein|nr:hypothetical protein [Desulfovibrio sp.]
MKVHCINDATRGRGYACFVCSEISGKVAQYTFSLCRASDQTFLGKSGWQSGEEKHSPDSQHANGSEVTLSVGPSITDALDDNENYRLTIYTEGMSAQSSVFSITNLYRGLQAGTGAVQMAAPRTDPAQQAPVPGVLSEPEASLPEPAPQDELPEPPPPAEKKRGGLVAMGVLLVLALSGTAVWWFALREQPQEAPPQTGEQPQNTQESTPQQPLEPPQAKEDVQHPAQPLSAREQVRQYLGGAPTVQGAMALSRSLTASKEALPSETQDSVYRLLYFAAQNGDVDAKLQLAKIADPLTHAWGSLRKSAAEAWRNYGAVAPQRPEAAQAMQNLKKWLEDENAKGNAEARAWIEDIARDQ